MSASVVLLLSLRMIHAATCSPSLLSGTPMIFKPFNQLFKTNMAKYGLKYGYTFAQCLGIEGLQVLN